jgi:hypothetical protein
MMEGDQSHQSNWHIRDNEVPEDFKQAIRDNHCKVELTPADQHRRNAAERAIQTFKGHFISVLAGVSNDFPIHQWDELLPQTILTLNLLRQSNVAPNVSAYAYHHGNFDYNRMPRHQWVAQFNFTSSQIDARHSVNIQAMGGISEHCQSTIERIGYSLRQPGQSGSQTQCSSNTHTSRSRR